ncbi:MAG: cobalamin biosynthesis protein CobD [Lachnospiraceae bacterium]|nr:cobalamin biosynthesis protein CobD [Lachnospiraceae bacterium]
MKYHIIAFVAGFILDLIFGDPHFMPHPIRLIGTLIGALEKRWNTEDKTKALRRGRLLVVTVLAITGTVTAVIFIICYKLNKYLGLAIESVMTYQILSIKDLRVESMRVYKALKADDLSGARRAVSMIVGRDADSLDEEGVAKAAIETVAENTSDGCIAPMIYTALGGPILGFLYKAVNTMDSMVGYKNDRYIFFGRCAAKLDDFVNYIPSRISAYLMIAASFLSGKPFNGKNAYKIYKRDCRKHASPNSAQTESVCAGALGIRLAGDASYFGKLVKKDYIGEELREISYEDIKYANRLLYVTVFLSWFLMLLIILWIFFLIR